MTEDKVGKRTNPMFPQLTGPLMGSLWKNAQLAMRLIVRNNRVLEQHRDSLRQFRRRWGERPPQGAEQWKSFFLQLAEIEDSVDDVKRYLASIEKDLETLVERGIGIVEANGVNGIYGGAVGIAERNLELARQLSEQANE